MFETITRRQHDATFAKRVATTAGSVIAHLALLAAAVVLPLWYYTPELPTPADVIAFVAPAPLPPPPPPPPAPAARPRAPRPVTPTPTPVAAVNPLAAPVEAPTTIQPEKPAPLSTPLRGVLGGLEGGVPGGIVSGVVGGIVAGLPAPPPPPAPTPKAVPVRVGGLLNAPSLVKRVSPDYPPIARAAKREGTVILEATVDEAGRVEDVKVLRSVVSYLDDAAVEAVRQWQYSPLHLNGRPTPFVLTVTVQFHLGNGAA